jgi:acetyl esterase/lipase
MIMLKAGIACCIVAVLTASALSETAAPSAEPYRVDTDVVWRTVDGIDLTLDAFVPARRRASRPAVLLIHGGGWTQGDKSNHYDEARQLAELGYLAFSINYRLAPNHPYPAAVDDVQAAVRWLRKPAQVKEYGINTKRIGALGGSAGAHLAGMLATLGEGSLKREARVRAAVSWSGPMDLVTVRGVGVDGPVSTFLGCRPSAPVCEDIAAEASPITHVDGSDAPLLLAHSESEFVPVEQAEVMAAALEDADVAHELIILPGARHARGFAADVWDETVAFFERYLGKPKP